MPEKTRLLETKFTGIGEVRDKEFVLIKKNKYVYLYMVDGTYFEVFKRVVNTRFNVESYPSSKQFGKTAFTATTLCDAEKRFNKLTKKYKK